MAERNAPGDYDRLHHFVSDGVWDEAPLERELALQADRLVGGADAFLVIDDTALPKKGTHSVGVAPRYASALGETASTAQSIADELAKAPSCRRIVFETGRMGPILFTVEPTRSARGLRGEPAGPPGAQLATHKTDRNDARGLAHLARTGFFKPVHVKSLSAHAVRSLIMARKKLVGQRVTVENQIRGLAVVFGIRLPRALNVAFIDKALQASEGIAGLSAAMRGLIAAQTAVMTAVAAIDADMRRIARASASTDPETSAPISA